MIHPKDPAFIQRVQPPYGADVVESYGMTIELEIASKILAAYISSPTKHQVITKLMNTNNQEVELHEWCLDHARKLIEEANNE